MRHSLRASLGALALLAGLAGPALAQPAYAPLPPPRPENVPPPPGSQYIWVAGHWHWNGAQYVWKRGHYVLRPARYSAWVPEHWAMRGGAWVWVPGHWR